MKFRSSPPSPPYMNRAFQVRMLMMVLSLGVVLLAIKITSQPEFWARIFPEDPTEQATGPEAEEARSEGDSRFPKIEMDEFLSIQTESEESVEQLESVTEETPSEAESSESESVSDLPILPETPPVESVSLDPQMFHSIDDYSVGVRSQEADSFFQLISYASRVPLEELNAASKTQVAREALMASPDHYRGEVIEIEGDLRRLERVQANQNGYGIEEYYIAWIITPTSDNIPYRVAAMFRDEELPVADLIEEEIPVRLSGYFFKIQGYHAKSDLQLTPLFIARRITAAPPASKPISLTESSNPGRWLFFVFGAMFAIVIWSVYRATVGATRMRKHRKEVLESEGDLSALQGMESVDPGEELRRLADSADEDE
ncbi:MAG: hypothetical protein HUJ26_07665 [Planctomycetaceae bacterium]|nr:hypothetical protein [Planctomycetaceae bacterium]